LAKKGFEIADLQVRAWQRQRPKGAQSCGGGLYFRALPDGADRWYFRYTRANRPHWILLGTYPDKSLSDARRDARRARVRLDDGRDIAAERHKAKVDAMAAKTVAELALEWYSETYVGRIEHPEVIKRRLDHYVIPKLGTMLINDVRPLDVDRVLKSIRKRHPATASNVLRDLRKMYRYAAKRELSNNNPAANFDIADAGGTPKSRTRFLGADELADLFLQMRLQVSFGLANELATKLLLALCPRKMELLGARWDEFDLQSGVWSLPGSKGGEPLAVPLAEPVVRWLVQAKGLSGRSEYVFPVRRISRRQRFEHVSPDTLNLAMKKVSADLDHFTIHDLRRTARTHLSELGVLPDVAERALNHTIKGTRGVYDRYSYFNERKSALTLWAQRLETIEMAAEHRAAGEPPAGVKMTGVRAKSN
jgi:integrase